MLTADDSHPLHPIPEVHHQRSLGVSCQKLWWTDRSRLPVVTNMLIFQLQELSSTRSVNSSSAVDARQFLLATCRKLSMPINSFSQLAGSFRCPSIPSRNLREAFDCDQFRLSAFREAFDCRQRLFPSRGKSSTAISGHFRPRARGRRAAPSAPWLSGCRPPWAHYLTGGLSPCEHTSMRSCQK